MQVFFIILISNLYYFIRNSKKKSFNVRYILEGDGITGKVIFRDVKY